MSKSIYEVLKYPFPCGDSETDQHCIWRLSAPVACALTAVRR